MAAPAAYSQMAGRIAAQLLKGLEKMKYTNMTPVQQKVLEMPNLTQDCLVQARTGTGKTIAFLLPALNTLLTKKDLPHKQVGLLVLAPTRELAQQIADECDQLTSEIQPKIECHVAVGGSNKKATLAKFMRGNPTVLVATPGRLIDYLSEEETRQKLKDVKVVVLDEADRMLDQGFQPALLQILRSIPPKATAGWQGMCFSATLPTEIQKVLHLVLKPNHVKISTIEEGGEPTVSLIPQSVIQVPSIGEVYPTLHALLAKEHERGTPLKAIVFCSTARQAGLLYQLFGSPGNAAPDNIPVFQMQSRMAQSARTRTVEDFKVAKDGIMFASDVVGRGMDFPDINLVVQVGLPADKEQYVHRVGRTGRAGKSGRAVMICIPEEMRFVRANREFPIKVADAPTFNGPKSSQEIIEEAFIQVPEQSKAQAYVAYLGFTKTLKKIHGMDAPAVVPWQTSTPSIWVARNLLALRQRPSERWDSREFRA